MNYDLNVHSHILYKPLQDGDCRQKNLIKQSFYARIKVPIVKKIYVGYSKLYYALLDLKKVVIFAYFIEFEIPNY
jgi:hypothetical protein